MKKLDVNNARKTRIGIKSWMQHPTKQQLYGHLQTIKIKQKDMRVTAGEVRMNSEATFPYRLLHMDVLVDQQELTSAQCGS